MKGVEPMGLDSKIFLLAPSICISEYSLEFILEMNGLEHES